MNVLFATQSESLQLFNELRKSLTPRLGIGRSGFIVADSLAYARWLKTNGTFEREGHVILREWDVTGARRGKPDFAKLGAYERTIGGCAGLFGAIVADRRLYMGRDCTYSQDYRRRFTDDELWCILQRGLEETERVFDQLRPDLLIGFICVTMLDYLAYLFAKARGVRVLNLRPTRIGDRITASPILNDPDPVFLEALARIHAPGYATAAREEARAIVDRVRREHGRYEGVVAPSDRPAVSLRLPERGRIAAILRVLRAYGEYRRGVARSDNHVPDPLRALLFAGLINPVRARMTRRLLSEHFVRGAEFRGLRYAFFPLHTEPEVSLLVYGRPFVNQIEIVRALAMSLPVDMVLVVKEHPWMVGKRTLSAYRKLLNIPRVRIAPPELPARDLISSSSLVAVVTGSIALEAAMLGKPVLTFGDCPYNALPPTMVRRCDDLRHLPAMIGRLLAEFQTDDPALEAYVASVLESSASVNLYSVLLKKQQRHAERAAAYDEEINRLAAYIATRVAEPPVERRPGAAMW